VKPNLRSDAVLDHFVVRKSCQRDEFLKAIDKLVKKSFVKKNFV
jgi:hypothetical protein